jgi:hypothetical protein
LFPSKNRAGEPLKKHEEKLAARDVLTTTQQQTKNYNFSSSLPWFL